MQETHQLQNRYHWNFINKCLARVAQCEYHGNNTPPVMVRDPEFDE
jgi:hypothetical protein